MNGPIIVELDDWVRATPEAAARARGITLETYVGELASLEAQAFREALGTPAGIQGSL